MHFYIEMAKREGRLLEIQYKASDTSYWYMLTEDNISLLNYSRLHGVK